MIDDVVNDGEECRLYMVLFVFVARDGSLPLRFEHGVASGTDEEDALTNAMETMGENHRGEVLLQTDAREVTEAEAESLFEMVVSTEAPATSAPALRVGPTRKKSRVERFFALLPRWLR